jgi:hypothetical protein
MLRHVALVRTKVSEKYIISIIRVSRIGDLGTKLGVTSNRSMLQRSLQLLVTDNIVPSSPLLVTLMMEAVRSSETSPLTRATRHDIPEDSILPLFRLAYFALLKPAGFHRKCW